VKSAGMVQSIMRNFQYWIRKEDVVTSLRGVQFPAQSAGATAGRKAQENPRPIFHHLKPSRHQFPKRGSLPLLKSSMILNQFPASFNGSVPAPSIFVSCFAFPVTLNLKLSTGASVITHYSSFINSLPFCTTNRGTVSG